MLTRFLTTTAVVLALSSPALAQTSTPPPSSPPPATGAAPSGEAPADQAATPPPAEKVITEQEETQVRSETLVGMEVMNPQDETVGEITDLIFNEQGQIVGAVVSVGGFLGIGSKQVALSWNEFDVRPEEKTAVIQLTKAQLEAAPSFKTLESKKAEEQRATQPPSGGGVGGTTQ